MRKKLSCITLATILTVLTACGSGSSNSTTSAEHTKAEATPTEASETPTKAVATPTNKPTSTPTPTPIIEEAKYEISDIRFDYYRNTIGDLEYYGIVEITNTGNSNLYLDEAVFDFEDNNGHLLQSDDFVSRAPYVIAPGKKGYFYNSIGVIDEGVSLSNGIRLVPNLTVKKANSVSKRYDITDLSGRKGSYGSPVITGRVSNNYSESSGVVYVTVFFYDSNKKILAIIDTNLSDIPANGMKSFECSSLFWNDSISTSDIDEYMVIAEEMYFQF